MSGHATETRKSAPNGDIVRKTLIVAVLIGGMLLLHQFAVPTEDFDPRGLLSLGFLVLAAYTIGELSETVRIPHITGYLLAGIVFGPSVAEIVGHTFPSVHLLPPLDEGIVSKRVLGQLGPIDALALALIALTAGGELKLEELRKSFRYVLGTTLGMVFTVVVLVTAYIVLVATVMPNLMTVFSGLPPAAMLALALVLATLAAATSPAVSIAVITSTGARGPVATTVLTGVVVGEITVVLLFSGVSSVALGLLGSSGSVSVVEALAQVGVSVGVGIVVGSAIALYLRYVATELLLFLVGTIYATVFVIQSLHGEVAVAFIAAGLVVGNFSGRGETLIREVERLSRPVYVVFFALAGAKLELQVLWLALIPAVGLFLVRAVGVYIGARTGARLIGAPPTVQQFAWTGFISQAGLAIALAGQAKAVLPEETGQALFSLSMAVIALCELVGPLTLQTGLARAGELDGGRTAEDETARTELDELSTWPEPVDPSTLWPAAPVAVGSPEVDRVLSDLELDLRALVHEHAVVPMGDLQHDAEQWLRQLRREWLRIARRAAGREGDGPELAASLRHDVGELAERWRDLLFDLQGRLARVEQSGPSALVDAVDRHASTLPVRVEAGVVDAVLVARPEGAWPAFRRFVYRARNRWVPIRRTLDLRELGRYHLSGLVPGQLEPVAALLIAAELHLAGRITRLFCAIAHELEVGAQVGEAEDTGVPPAERVAEHLNAARVRVDAGFQVAADELDAMARDGASQATRVVTTALRDLQDDAATLGTMDLPRSRRRFGRVFAERNRGLGVLANGVRSVRPIVAGRHAQLGLELELVGLEARVRAIIRERGGALARHVRGRGLVQLARIQVSLGEWLDHTRLLLDAPPAAGVVSRQLRRDAEPLVHRIREARASVDQLVAELSDEGWVGDLIEALLARTHLLSETYTLPVSRTPRPRGTLPHVVPPTEIAFRELVGAFVETRVARDLLDVTTDLAGRAREMGETLEEVERVTTFNVELSCAELDVLDEGAPISPETGDIVRAMVLGAVGRSHHRLTRLTEVAELTADQTEQRVHDSVIGQFEALRGMILDGRVGELRAVWLRDVGIGQIARRAEAWRGWWPEARATAEDFARRAMGEERIEAVRARLGLRPTLEQRDQRAAFAPPEPLVAVPVVYRRLFSDLPLEAGDVVSGRQTELERLQIALSTPSPLRTAAVVGVDAHSAAALVSAAIRGAFPGALRLEAKAPVDTATVDAWLARVGAGDGEVVVVECLHWLFERRPGGLAPLERLIDGVLADGGRHPWVWVADSAVWAHLSRASALADATGTLVELDALSVDELERAVLSRHAMSGYEIEFDADDDLGWQLQHVLLGGEDRERRRRQAWFRTLHSASAGVLQDALRLWMAAIRQVDDEQERVRIGAVPRPPLTRLAQLPEEVLLTLVETGRQGWMVHEQHARLFRTTPGAALAHLTALVHQGLLVRDGEVLKLAPHLRGSIHRVLARKGWT